jgi:hypothetical protein
MVPKAPLSVLTLLALIFACAQTATAQSKGTATRAFGLEAFAGYTWLATSDGSNGSGFFLGADLTHAMRHFDVAGEFRYTRGGGDTVTEQSFLAGGKIGKRFGRFSPYATGFIGYGTVTYLHPIVFANGPYTHDNSVVYDGGGGIDYDLIRGFALKADFQYQHWNLGSELTPLTPMTYSGGIVYRIPAGRLKGLPQ